MGVLGTMSEKQKALVMEIVAAYGQGGARHKLLLNYASTQGLFEVEAVHFILENLGDFEDRENCTMLFPRYLVLFGHQMGIVDPRVLEDVENFARGDLRYPGHLMYFRDLEALALRAPLVRPVDSRGQTEIIHGAAGVRSSILHRDYTALVENRATLVGSRRCVLQDLGASDSTARGEAGTYQWYRISSVGADNGDSSRILNWSAAANPNAGSGSGGSAGDHIFIDMRAFLIENSDLLGQELRETESESSWARRILETTIGTLLPAAVVNARDFFSDTPDVVKLAGNMILPALLAFCLIGMLHKRKAGSILRLATCAAIAAATFGVSSQLSDRIYVFIAVLAGVALSFTTLTA